MNLTWELLYAALVVFGASVIRGYSGFGFALISAVTLSFAYPPAQVTPVILCLEIFASSWLLKKAFNCVDWKGLRLIIAGAIVTLPLGAFALAHTPVMKMKMFISVVIILLCAGLIKKRSAVNFAGSGVTFATGLLSGFLTGVAAIGGPPVILFYYSSSRSVAVSRASMIAFFLLVDFLALMSCLWYGLLDRHTVVLSAWMILPMGLGLRIGNGFFGRLVDEEKFRKRVLVLLLFLAFLSLVTSI